MLSTLSYDGSMHHVPWVGLIRELSILRGLGVDGVGRNHCSLDSSCRRVCRYLLWPKIRVRQFPDSRLSAAVSADLALRLPGGKQPYTEYGVP